MTGVFQHSIDSKGRIFIPAKLREELGDAFYIALSEEDCLTAYSMDRWNALLEKTAALPLRKQRRLRPFFAHASKCELDAQGRILIPQNLRDEINLDKNAAIIGNGLYAEIWNAEKWAEIEKEETTPENLAAVFEELDI